MIHSTVDGIFSSEKEAIENVYTEISKKSENNGRYPVCVKTQTGPNTMSYGMQFWTSTEIIAGVSINPDKSSSILCQRKTDNMGLLDIITAYKIDRYVVVPKTVQRWKVEEFMDIFNPAIVYGGTNAPDIYYDSREFDYFKNETDFKYSTTKTNIVYWCKDNDNKLTTIGATAPINWGIPFRMQWIATDNGIRFEVKDQSTGKTIIEGIVNAEQTQFFAMMEVMLCHWYNRTFFFYPYQHKDHNDEGEFVLAALVLIGDTIETPTGSQMGRIVGDGEENFQVLFGSAAGIHNEQSFRYMNLFNYVWESHEILDTDWAKGMDFVKAKIIRMMNKEAISMTRMKTKSVNTLTPDNSMTNLFLPNGYFEKLPGWA